MYAQTSHMDVAKPGTPRQANSTLQIIQMQIELAALGVAKPIEEAQSRFGIKDKIAQHWIDILLNMARTEQSIQLNAPQTRDARLNDKFLKGDARKGVKAEICRNIQHELLLWLYTQPKHRYQVLPPTSRKFWVQNNSVYIQSLNFFKALRSQLRPGDHFNPLLTLEGMSHIHKFQPSVVTL